MNYKISEKLSFWGFCLGIFGSLLGILWISYNFYKDYKIRRKNKAMGLGKAINIIV